MKFKSTFALGEKMIGDNTPSYLIAEIGLNHNGDLTLAKKLIDEAIKQEPMLLNFNHIKL